MNAEEASALAQNAKPDLNLIYAIIKSKAIQGFNNVRLGYLLSVKEHKALTDEGYKITGGQQLGGNIVSW